MKLLYFSDSIFPSNRANSVHVMCMCEALAQNGADVTCIGFKSKSKEDPFTHYGIKTRFSLILEDYKIEKGKLYRHAFRVQKYIQRLKPDLIIGRSLFSLFLAKGSRIPLVFENHNPYSGLSWLKKFCLKKLIRSVSFLKMIVISEKLKQIILTELRELNADKICVLHDGARAMQQLINVNSENPASVNVGYTGTVSQGRGIELIVRLASMLPQYMFHIVGGTVADIERLIPEMNIAEIKNLVVHGFIPFSQTADLAGTFQIMLAPYQKNLQIGSGKNTSEYMSPLKVFEYMSMKKAIVASDLPVLKEVLNESNAVLVESDNIKAWADAIEMLGYDYHKRMLLAQQAYNDFVKHYSWKSRAQSVLNFMKA